MRRGWHAIAPKAWRARCAPRTRCDDRRVRCLPNGCIAELVMVDEHIKKLRRGKTATFIIFQTPEEGIGFPMSLAGFGEGYDKLP